MHVSHPGRPPSARRRPIRILTGLAVWCALIVPPTRSGADQPRLRVNLSPGGCAFPLPVLNGCSGRISHGKLAGLPQRLSGMQSMSLRGGASAHQVRALRHLASSRASSRERLAACHNSHVAQRRTSPQGATQRSIQRRSGWTHRLSVGASSLAPHRNSRVLQVHSPAHPLGFQVLGFGFRGYQ
jgi:hypothetical protein